MKRRLTALVLLASTAPLAAQWLMLPTPDIPRAADGEPDLSVPAPRAADEVEKQARAPDNASRKSSAAARRESTGTRSRGVYRCDERSP